MILIIGAGLAGLSTAFHLGDRRYRVVEKEKETGGLCRSYRLSDFTFDMTGHLLHFRKPEIKSFIEGLLAGKLEKHIRRSFIYSNGIYTEYPFQVNTYGLPREIVRDCLLGFIETLTKPGLGAENDRSFKSWISDNLGEGMARHFMVPFNEKLWQVPLDELTSDWVSWLIPKPRLEDVVNGALGIKDKAFGYNASFLYPAHGGIRLLPDAILAGVRDVICGTELMEVDTQRRRATFQDGRVEHYETLVSTIPIPELIRRCTDLPSAVRQAAAGLRCVSVYSINLGVSREQISDKHWVYFPEPEFPFYRAGFPMNFSPSLGPPGSSSLYVEQSHHAENSVPTDMLLDQVRNGLERAGILHPDDDIVVADVRDIRYAYVIFDRHRARVLPGILTELERRGIHSIGRYGRWEHSSMEDAIAHGKALGEKLQTQ